MDALVSIIVPVYKVEKYLERCVASLTAQSYANIEILLVDDGSPDRCGQMCDDLAKTDSRIRVFHKVNGGLSDARNYGTERANGDFVAYIDSDDYISGNYIARMMLSQLMHNADVVCCDFVKTTQDQVDFTSADREDFVFTGREACLALMGQYYMPLVTAWCKIYRREIVQKYPFPVGRIHEDEATTCKFLYAAKKVVLCGDKLYGYYVNPDSITRNGITSDDIKRLWGLSERAAYFDGIGDLELANKAWSWCVGFLITQAVLQKKNPSEIVVPFIRERKLWNRIDLKTYIRLLTAWVMPGILRKRIEANT